MALAMANINADSVEFIENLLSQKNPADVNSQDAKGRTPLYHLIEGISERRKRGGGLFGNSDYEELSLKIVKMLISAGANM